MYTSDKEIDEVRPEDTGDTQARGDVELDPPNEVPDLYEECDHQLAPALLKLVNRTG
jgi:hypothetical protein